MVPNDHVVHKVISSYVVFDSYFKSFPYVLMKLGSLAHLHLRSFAIDVGFRVKVCVCVCVKVFMTCSKFISNFTLVFQGTLECVLCS
jgi:hypothetical protein